MSPQEPYRPCERVLEETVTEIDGRNFAYGMPPRIGEERKHVRDRLHILMQGVDDEWTHVGNSIFWNLDCKVLPEMEMTMMFYELEADDVIGGLQNEVRNLLDKSYDEESELNEIVREGPVLHYLQDHLEELTLENLMRVTRNSPSIFFGAFLQALGKGKIRELAYDHHLEGMLFYTDIIGTPLREGMEQQFTPFCPGEFSEQRLGRNVFDMICEIEIAAEEIGFSDEVLDLDPRRLEGSDWAIVLRLCKAMREKGYTHADLAIFSLDGEF